MRTALLATLATLLLAGCGFDEPSPSVIGIDCGVENAQMGTEMNQEGRRCLLDAFKSGTPAQFVSRMTTIEGDPIVRTYAVFGPGDLRIAHDARLDKWGSGKIELLRCARLVPVADWNRAMPDNQMRPEDVFVEDGCEPYSA
jgi:hypothetical protein